MTQLGRMLAREAQTYLAVSDFYRENGSAPNHRAEADEDLTRYRLSRKEIKAQCHRFSERVER